MEQNPRCGPIHISLLVAIIHEANLQAKNPISIYSRGLMRKAKIGGVATYHRVIKDLQEFNFIRYEPSYNPLFGSSIYILKQ